MSILLKISWVYKQRRWIFWTCVILWNNTIWFFFSFFSLKNPNLLSCILYFPFYFLPCCCWFNRNLFLTTCGLYFVNGKLTLIVPVLESIIVICHCKKWNILFSQGRALSLYVCVCLNATYKRMRTSKTTWYGFINSIPLFSNMNNN